MSRRESPSVYETNFLFCNIIYYIIKILIKYIINIYIG